MMLTVQNWGHGSERLQRRSEVIKIRDAKLIATWGWEPRDVTFSSGRQDLHGWNKRRVLQWGGTHPPKNI